MKRSGSLVLCVVVLVGIGIFLAMQISAKMAYEQLRDKIVEVPRFVTHPLDAEAVGFLESVRDTWDVHDRDCPDSIFAEISTLTGLGESVEGVVDFYTHEIPEFSFFEYRRNAQEGVMATAMAVALPVSVDYQIYCGDGVCFIKLTEALVEVYEDTGQGLSRSLYTKAKSGGAGGAGVAPSAS